MAMMARDRNRARNGLPPKVDAWSGGSEDWGKTSGRMEVGLGSFAWILPGKIGKQTSELGRSITSGERSRGAAWESAER